MNPLRKLFKILNYKHYKWLFHIFKPYKWQLLILTLVNIASSVILIFQVIFSKHMIDLSISDSVYAARYYILLFSLSLLLSMSLNYYLGIAQATLQERLNYMLQSRLFSHYYRTTWQAAQEKRTGEILTLLTADINNVVSGVVATLPGILALILQFIIAFITLTIYDPLLAIFAFVLAPLSAIFSWLWGKKIRANQKKSLELESRYRSYITELVQNLLIIKTFEYQARSMDKLSAYQQAKYSLRSRQAHLSEQGKLCLSAANRIGYFIAFVYGASKLSAGRTTFGTFTAFLQLIGQIQMPIVGLSAYLPQMMMVITSAERLAAFEQLPHEALPDTDNPTLPSKLTGIRLDGLHFSYVPDAAILSNISLDIHAGEMLALLGPSGSGKTTLIRLLLALLQPNQGTVTLQTSDGPQSVCPQTRPFFTYVPQGNTLFSGTIFENLALCLTDSSIDRIRTALVCACADGFIDALPHGINTDLHEHASDLSEGQAQRLCIARALLRDAPVLILDEATSALDQETEQRIIENIKRYYPDKTCIAITHRSTILPYCDRIYKLVDRQLILQQ